MFLYLINNYIHKTEIEVNYIISIDTCNSTNRLNCKKNIPAIPVMMFSGLTVSGAR